MPSVRLPSRKGMNARFKLANLNRAHHFAAGVFDGGGDFVGRLLQLNAKRRRGGGGRAIGSAGARQNRGPRIITP